MITEVDESMLDCSFMFNDAPTDEEIKRERHLCKTADQWRRECEICYPGIDAEEQYRLKLEENRQEKMKRCGSPLLRFNPQSGTWEIKTFKCEICDCCQKSAAYAIKQKVIEIAEKQPLRLMTIPESERAKTVRRLRDNGEKWQLYVVSKSNGSTECHILVATDNESIGEPFRLYTWDYKQWVDCNKPEGKRNSGKLIGSTRSLVRNTDKSEEDENIIDSGQVLLREIEAEFEKLPEGIVNIHQALEIAGDYAICQTKDMAPQDIDELQECIREREQLAIEAIRLMGGTVYGVSFHRTDTLKMTLELPERWLAEAKKHHISQWRHLLEPEQDFELDF